MDRGKPFKNISGNRYDSLVVLNLDHRDKIKKGYNYYYRCKCDCGNECVKSLNYLTRNDTKHKCCDKCGEVYRAEASYIHGGHKNAMKEYSAWQHMKARCLNPNNHNYHHYGGRGIKVCERWINSFENFINDMGEMPQPKNKYSLDRIDHDGDYTPENCKWSTQKDQLNNQRRTKIYSYKGISKPFSYWCEELGLNKNMIRSYIRRNQCSFEQAVEYYKKKGVIK